MKEALKSYFSFHRSQRKGLVILMGLLLLLLIVFAVLHQPAIPGAGAQDHSQVSTDKNSIPATDPNT